MGKFFLRIGSVSSMDCELPQISYSVVCLSHLKSREVNEKKTGFKCKTAVFFRLLKTVISLLEHSCLCKKIYHFQNANQQKKKTQMIKIQRNQRIPLPHNKLIYFSFDSFFK